MADTLEEIIARQGRPTLEDIVAESEKPEPGLMERYKKFRQDHSGGIDELTDQVPTLRVLKRGLAPALESFNESFAQTLGFPVEVVNEAIGHAEKLFEHSQYRDNPGEATQAIRDAMGHFGIKTLNRKAESLMEQIGEEGFRQFLMMGGLRAIAPRMAGPTYRTKPVANAAEDIEYMGAPAIAGKTSVKVSGPQTAFGGAVSDLGRAAIEKPATMAAGNVGASFGVPVGGYWGEVAGKGIAPFLTNDSATEDEIVKAGRTIGEFKGGMAGGIVTTWAGNKTRLIPKTESGVVPSDRAPLFDPRDNPEIVRARAGERLKSTLIAIDKSILDNINMVAEKTQGVPSPALAKELTTRIDLVKDQARAIQAEAYSNIPKKAVIAANDTALAVENMMTDATAPAEVMPASILQGLERMLNLTKFRPTFEQLNEWRRTIQDIRWASQSSTPGGPVPTQGMSDRLQTLEEAIFRDMENSLGDHVDGWRYASNLTKQLNDRFTRGPIGQLLGLDRQNTERIRPEDAANFLLKTPGGMPAVLDAGKHLPEGSKANYINPATGKQVTGQQPEGTGDMLKAADAMIRQKFVEEAEKAAIAQYGTPEKIAEAKAGGANAFFQRIKGDIERYTRVTADLSNTVQKNADLIAQKREWENGVFARYHARETPQAAVKELLSGPNPGMDVRRFVAGMRLKDNTPDVDAIKGLGRAMADDLIQNSTSPEHALAKLANTRIRPAYAAAWGESRLEQFERLLTAASAAKQQDDAMSKGPVRTVIGMVSGVLANWSGHAAAWALGGGSAGSLRYPAIMNRKANAIIEEAFQAANPMHVFADAVYSKELSDILMTRLPENITDSYQFLKRMRAYSTMQEMAYNKSIKGYMERYRREQEPQVPESR